MGNFSFSIDHFAERAAEGDVAAIQRLGRLGALHESLSEEILDTLAAIQHPARYNEISRIAVAQPSTADKALSILVDARTPLACHDMRVIAFAMPDRIPAMFDALKEMESCSASFEISMIARRFTQYADIAIEALRYRNNELGVRHIIDIGESFRGATERALETACELRAAFNDRVLIDSGIERLQRKLQAAPSP